MLDEGGVEGDGECVEQSGHLIGAHEIIFIFPSTIEKECCILEAE